MKICAGKKESKQRTNILCRSRLFVLALPAFALSLLLFAPIERNNFKFSCNTRNVRIAAVLLHISRSRDSLRSFDLPFFSLFASFLFSIFDMLLSVSARCAIPLRRSPLRSDFFIYSTVKNKQTVFQLIRHTQHTLPSRSSPRAPLRRRGLAILGLGRCLPPPPPPL